MSIECDFYSDQYSEQFIVSDGTIKCCETGVLIPAGFPCVKCMGRCEGEKWTEYQCVEVWRWARNQSRKHGHCFSFGGILEELSYAEMGDPSELFAFISFNALRKRVRKRYEQGKQPRLHRYEKENLERGMPVPHLPFYDKEKATK